MQPNNYENIAGAATLVVKAGPGVVFSLTCTNANAATRYVQLHNLAVVATTTVSVPVESFMIPTGSQIIVGTDYFTNNGAKFDTGITMAVSTTRDVYTAATGTDHVTRIKYA